MVISELPVSESEKREALEAVLASGTFARSVQLRAFLRYICERELAGQCEGLTEYQIAIDVLGRRKDFSLSDDSSVRNRAYELRQRLEKYYTQEQPRATIRIAIPRGGYVPYYTRYQPPAENETVAVAAVLRADSRPRFGWRALAAVAALCLLAGGLAGSYWTRPHPSPVVREAWGPLAEPGGDLLISIATNLHLIVRPHIPAEKFRFPAPEQLDAIYGPTRPRQPGVPLYMVPAQLSVPLAELAAAADLTNMRLAFGGSYQLLPESEAPVAALRGRNSMLIGSGTNSQAATLLLRNFPFTVDYDKEDHFAVFDQRKPDGRNELFFSQATDDPYGLISVLTTTDAAGKPKRTVVFSGGGSAAVQAAAEFFCSPIHMGAMKDRFRAAGLKGFPPAYQIILRTRTSGVRLISYQYVTHEVVPKSADDNR
ncbi:conserved hypothetical protein [Candidatus Sulfopaludibacter sp. SbA3]|nr:conserved hypothetical protein [Candidatus Sulfopaludibacter sp. SbA3]